jgi:alanine racemase
VADRVIGLTPAQTLSTYPVRVEWLETGETVGYGRTFTCSRRTKVMTLPVGYGDGYPRLLSNQADVLVSGRRAPIIGRVCMDQMMVDVSNIPEAREGDPVTLIGSDGSLRISMEELGDLSGRFNYELACNISPRVPRLFKGGTKHH